ncbi:MAG TPA: dihydrodipicolinate synthase family protein [Dehalococcoidia bacterium]|nr:dihydrodipicolinate synthase family protein [Dehalococcoidia bacterium]
MMLTRDDIRGVSVMAPTPCKEGHEGWDSTDSVDLDESARMIDNLIRDGVGSIALNGTTGECAALLWDEKKQFVATCVDVAKKRVPIFAGATALGTKEVIRQMRALKDIGADGAFIGLPLWQTPSLETQVQFFADLSEAVPDMPIMVYSNQMFFKSTFPTPFWAGVAKKAPTVITNKVTYSIEHLLDDIKAAGHQINFLPAAEGGTRVYNAWRMCRGYINAVWSTSASMGPEPMVALADAIAKDDEKRVEEICADLASVPMFHGVDFSDFPKYNAQFEKARFRAAGYIKCGPSRAPYLEMPESWAKAAEANGKAWAELRKKYMKVAAS